ncbi:Lsr2 family protein [Mycolicibacterium sp. P1-18]|uniref:histone-like nucleoid-structuring protein Lsr2 n=1 Tax=Mycolicibacterium sp. P1-18 TaxID=2024615 RepID=UPI0011F2D627|nr:Lsr2 family protein [Mycolicibacterium sp. P1-18]KAA0093573.1 Lsr2 family protein [Mycolicibacterium sp. P1-18]
MAERIIRQLIDDLDQTEIVDGKGGSVEFGLRGTTYTLDLTAANIAKLERALAPFVEAATRASGADPARAASAPAKKKRSSRRTTKRPVTKSTAAVRAWAAENGHDVSPRGRIPAEVSQAYDAAHEPTK